MTYKDNIPQPTDKPSNSQNDFLINFGQLNTIFDANHYKYDHGVAADRGKHKYVTYVDQVAVDPVALGTDWISYAKDTPIGTGPAPFTRSATQIYSMPIVIDAGDIAVPSGNDQNLFDMTGQPPMMGFIYVLDVATINRSRFALFIWNGVVVAVNTSQQLSGSTVITEIGTTGTWFTLDTTANRTWRTKIWATLI
jgi:hypothetical protein